MQRSIFPRLFHRDHLWRSFSWVGLVLLGFYILPLRAVEESLLLILTGLLSSVAILAGIRLHRPSRVWHLTAIAQVLVVIGDVLFTQEVYLQNIAGYQQTRAIIYAAATLVFVTCYWVMLWQKRACINTDVLINGSIIALSLGVFAFVFHIFPYLERSLTAWSWVEMILLPAIFSLLILPISILLMSPLGSHWSIRFVFLGLGCFLVGTAFYNFLTANGLPVRDGQDFARQRLLIALNDAFTSACYLFLGAALLHPSIRALDPAEKAVKGFMTTFGRAILALGILIAPVVFIIDYIQGQDKSKLIYLFSIGPVALLVIWRYNHLAAKLEAQNRKLTHQQEILYRQAHTDPLTGLPNRLYLYRFLELALQRAEESQHKGAVLMIDLNRFKEVNDHLGHDAGDQAMIQIAEQLNRMKRADDVVARWGGDEFVVVLENIHSAENALSFGRRLFREVSFCTAHPLVSIEVTLSVGVCMFPARTQDVDELLKWADRAMYQAKRALGDKVVLYSA